MKIQVKWLLSGILVLGIIGYMLYSSVKPIETDLLGVQTQTVSQTFKEEGIVQSDFERPIHSLISGEVDRILVEEGQEVKAGELLLEIDGTDLEYQLKQLKAQKMSLLGEEKRSTQELQKQLGQLQGQLESIKGQEKQAHRSPLNAEIAQQRLVIDEAKHQLARGQEDYRKLKVLYESGAISKTELEQAENNVKQLENSVLQQEQALKLIEERVKPMIGTDQYYAGLKNALQTQIHVLKEELGQGEMGKAGAKQYYQGMLESMDVQIDHLNYLLAHRSVTAPSAGIVKEIPIREGEAVSSQTQLLSLVSTDNFEVEVYLLTEDVIEVEEGMQVELIQERRNGDYTFSGSVKAIAPVAEEKVSALGLIQQKVKVTIATDASAPELRPGYALDVLFTTLEQHNKLAVPKTSIFPYEGEDAIWVLSNGKAMIRTVEKGLETDELVVIEKGLEEGDQVIKNPQQEGLEEGKRVK